MSDFSIFEKSIIIFFRLFKLSNNFLNNLIFSFPAAAS